MWTELIRAALEQRALLAGLGPRRAQASLIGALGTLRSFDVSVIPLHHQGQISSFACSAMDVTDRVAAEQQLHAQLAFTQLVMETSPLPQSVITLVVNLPEQPMRTRVDPARYQQVVRSVLANANKFSPPHSRIDIGGDRTDSGALLVLVCDEGPGIPAAELDRVFDAFVQSSQTKDGSGGTGLGLAICRKIIEPHDGSIHAENLPGRGTAFHIVVPERTSSSGERYADSTI